MYVCRYVIVLMFLILYFLGYIDPIMDIERKSNAELTMGKGLFVAEKDLLAHHLSLLA